MQRVRAYTMDFVSAHKQINFKLLVNHHFHPPVAAVALPELLCIKTHQVAAQCAFADGVAFDITLSCWCRCTASSDAMRALEGSAAAMYGLFSPLAFHAWTTLHAKHRLVDRCLTSYEQLIDTNQGRWWQQRTSAFRCEGRSLRTIGTVHKLYGQCCNCSSWYLLVVRESVVLHECSQLLSSTFLREIDFRGVGSLIQIVGNFVETEGKMVKLIYYIEQ